MWAVRNNQRSEFYSATFRKFYDRRNRTKHKVLVIVLMIYLALMLTGAKDYFYTKSFETFQYPLDIDMKSTVTQILSEDNLILPIDPINVYPYSFSSSVKCRETNNTFLVILVRSEIRRFAKRAAIRATYGRPDAVPGVTTETVFFIGTAPGLKVRTQRRIEKEINKFDDVILAECEDDILNNTAKTVLMLKWAFEDCSKAQFYLFTDDDAYISVSKLIQFLKKETVKTKRFNILNKVDYSGIPLFAGHVMNSTPQRLRYSQWRVTLDEYPWDKWPPYVAGSYVISNKSLKDIYIASIYVKHFRFQEIYLGIIAKKLGLILTHSDGFHYHKKIYSKEGYRDVIATHGYFNHHELIAVWNDQNENLTQLYYVHFEA